MPPSCQDGEQPGRPGPARVACHTPFKGVSGGQRVAAPPYDRGMTITYEWRGAFENAAVNILHAEAFGHPGLDVDWLTRVRRHSVGWVCARRSGELVGFVNVAWDGECTPSSSTPWSASVSGMERIAPDSPPTGVQRVPRGGCEWLHVDFEEELAGFYFGACGFRATSGGTDRALIGA